MNLPLISSYFVFEKLLWKNFETKDIFFLFTWPGLNIIKKLKTNY